METSLVPLQTESLFRNAESFDHISRIAKVFADSQLVPPAFQKNIANCIIALEIAHRLGASPMMVIQNLNIIHGKPTFSATFMIATVNSCGRFTPMRFTYVGERDTPEWGCYAVAKARDGTELKGVPVTMAIAKSEGWISRQGSKWPSMPELMLSYRAATWWTRMYAPEMLMGFPTEDEVYDIKNVTDTAPAEDKPAAVSHKKGKGVAAMKQAFVAGMVEAKEPAKETTTPVEGNLGEPAPVSPTPPYPGPVHPDQPAPPEPQPVLTRVRCEITALTEKSVKKKDGNGIVTLVGLKGEMSGEAYFDGVKAKLPNVGAVLDLTLEERIHNNAPIHLIKTFEQVG